jgi:hypothetical protein
LVNAADGPVANAWATHVTQSVPLVVTAAFADVSPTLSAEVTS